MVNKYRFKQIHGDYSKLICLTSLVKINNKNNKEVMIDQTCFAIGTFQSQAKR